MVSCRLGSSNRTRSNLQAQRSCIPVRDTLLVKKFAWCREGVPYLSVFGGRALGES